MLTFIYDIRCKNYITSTSPRRRKKNKTKHCIDSWEIWQIDSDRKIFKTLKNEIPFYRHILHVHIEEKSDSLLQWQRKQNNWYWGICSKTVTTFSCTYIRSETVINTHLTFSVSWAFLAYLSQMTFLLTDGKLWAI